MCPVDLKRSLGENTHAFVVGPATLKGYRLGFRYYSAKRQCGALDVLPDPSSEVHGVLYRLTLAIEPSPGSAGRRSSRRLPPRIRCRETGWTVLRRGQNLRRGAKRHRWRLPPTTGISMWCYEEQLPASCQSLTAGSFLITCADYKWPVPKTHPSTHLPHAPHQLHLPLSLSQKRWWP